MVPPDRLMRNKGREAETRFAVSLLEASSSAVTHKEQSLLLVGVKGEFLREPVWLRVLHSNNKKILILCSGHYPISILKKWKDILRSS